MATGRSLVDREGKALRSEAPREVGCIVCGRGHLKIDLPDGRKVDTSLELVDCTDTNAHLPGGSHEGKCLGKVYRHRNREICIAVKRVSRN